MNPLVLHEFHQQLGARFGGLNGAELALDYGRPDREHAMLRESAGVMDWSGRSRVCLTGADRVRFLHGQVTNDVKKLKVGEGNYAVLTTNKGKIESDVNILCLADELLLDFEPGFTAKVTARLEKYLVADEVQVVDAAPWYGMLSVQGPAAAAVTGGLKLIQEAGGWPAEILARPLNSAKLSTPRWGDIYLVHHARLGGAGGAGFDLLVPNPALPAVAEALLAAARAAGGGAVGWSAWETARIEAGMPRYGADMDESHLPQECGIESRAVAYDKGCYLGQEVINRLHTLGHVNRELRGLRLADDLPALPLRGDRLFHAGREVGSVTSAAVSPTRGKLALGYVRREQFQPGTVLELRTAEGNRPVTVAALPFA